MTDRRARLCLATLLIALVPLAHANGDDWVMPGMSTQWIARDMEMNGLPASMRTLHIDRSLDQVLAHYRRQWAGSIDERREGAWHVLATRQRGQFASLRLKRSGIGVIGVLTTSADPANAAPDLESSLPVPPGLTRLAHQAFRDDGSSGENLTLMSPRSVAYERQAFSAVYRSDGWARAEDRATQTVPDGHVLQFLRGKDQVRVVLYRDPELADGRTLILVTAHRD